MTDVVELKLRDGSIARINRDRVHMLFEALLNHTINDSRIGVFYDYPEDALPDDYRTYSRGYGVIVGHYSLGGLSTIKKIYEYTVPNSDVTEVIHSW